MRALLDLVAATRCVGCGSHSDGELCPRCASDVVIIGASVCDRCGAPVPSSPAGPTWRCACGDLSGFRRARSLVAFVEPARSLTLALKRRARTATIDAVGGLLADLAVAHDLVGPDHVVTYVPAGRAARRRGFDHAALLARATARRLGSPCAALLVRAHEGPRQADVPMAERRRNVRDRFRGKPSQMPVEAPILLVDDVFTTGATAEACARALAKSGAGAVDVVTWARTLRRH